MTLALLIMIGITGIYLVLGGYFAITHHGLLPGAHHAGRVGR